MIRLVRTPPWAPFLSGTANPWWDGEEIPMDDSQSAEPDGTPAVHGDV